MESGFSDITFYASIPMSEEEFAQTAQEIGMTPPSETNERQPISRPWWNKEGSESDTFILNRTNQKEHQDYIEGFFDKEKQTGHFVYFNKYPGLESNQGPKD